jgi:predicted nucleic-acid-binding protein
MLAVDTNILVRYIAKDDSEQSPRAANLMKREEIFICKTVLLELEWVLRAVYKLEFPAMLRALNGIVGLPNVSVEDEIAVAQALIWFEDGLDFADALHLASRSQAKNFVSFDSKLRKKLASNNRGLVIEPP